MKEVDSKKEAEKTEEKTTLAPVTEESKSSTAEETKASETNVDDGRISWFHVLFLYPSSRSFTVADTGREMMNGRECRRRQPPLATVCHDVGRSDGGREAEEEGMNTQQ